MVGKLFATLIVILLGNLSFSPNAVADFDPLDAQTLTATNITTHSATLRAKVKPNGYKTFVYFLPADGMEGLSHFP